MKFQGILLVTLALFILNCTSTKNPQESEQRELEEMFSRIQELASKEECTDPDNWSYIAYGEKACGGPLGYIAYSKEIDVQEFKSLVEQHRSRMDEFNKKWDLSSDCSLPPEPLGVRCENGKPVFEYP